MPRFYFDVYDGIAIPDSTGIELVDVCAAQKEAAKRAAILLGDAPDRLWRDGDWTVWVRDDTGMQLFSVVVLGMLAPAMRGTSIKNT